MGGKTSSVLINQVSASQLPECPIPGYTLRCAVSADIPFIVEMDRLHFKPELDRNYPGQWSQEKSRELIAENLNSARIVEFAGQSVGCYYWWKDGETAVLSSIQIRENHRFKGIGTWLMNCFEAEVKEQKMAGTGLAVYLDNSAIAFYEKLGYKITGNDGPYAILMEKDIGIDYRGTNGDGAWLCDFRVR
ncbi:MAG: GNAT family N-acetyltransferase [Candidatus Wallbacteria bacterium]|nr:GNAT family N-acetyltransferase [Candidatus Wallbacteria bacterium]